MMRAPRHRSGRAALRTGFTLIELLVVIVIIAILTASFGVSFLSAQETARITRATAESRELGNAINRMLAYRGGIKRTRGESIFTDFIRLVEDNYKRERRVSWYGGQMCISSKYLSETVKNVSGRAPNDWIDNYVMTELRAQLRNTTKSVKEIAAEMNFRNQSFLGKYFKEHAGMSPVAYRRNPAGA